MTRFDENTSHTGKALIQKRWFRSAIVCGLLLLFAMQLIRVARISSASWDESHHLFDGYTVLTAHDYTLNPEVPPLIKLLAAAPLLALHLDVPANQSRTIPTEAFLGGRQFVFGNGGDRVLFPARMACMLVSLLMALLIYGTSARMFGWVAGLFALAMFAFDPNFMAHGTFIATDVGSSCLFLATLYIFYRYCKEGGGTLLAGVCVASGLLLVTKFTSIFVFPILLLCIVLEWFSVRNNRLFGRRLAAMALIALVGWGSIWMFYGFRYKAASSGHELNPALPLYLSEAHNQHQAHVLARIAQHHLLPEAYIWGLENTRETEFQDKSYLMGHLHRHGVVSYFPLSFLIKSTLPLLLMVCLLPVGLAYGLRCWRELGYLLIPIVVYFIVCMQSQMNIGLRHLFPVYGFTYVLIGGVAAALLRRDSRWSYALTALLCWQVVTSARAASSYIAYGNEAWGGPSQVHHYLSNSSTDWGQQLKSVKKYLDTQHPAECWFAYNADGPIELSDYGISCKRLPTTDNLWWLDLPMDVPSVIHGTVLVSDSDLEGIEFGDGPLNPYDGFRNLRPVAAIDNGVYVYQGTFDVSLAAALVRAHVADKLVWAGKSSEALPYARAAEALASHSAQVQMTLANALAGGGQRTEALVHYRLALKSAELERPELQEYLLQASSEKIKEMEASGLSRLRPQ